MGRTLKLPSQQRINTVVQEEEETRALGYLGRIDPGLGLDEYTSSLRIIHTWEAQEKLPETTVIALSSSPKNTQSSQVRHHGPNPHYQP